MMQTFIKDNILSYNRMKYTLPISITLNKEVLVYINKTAKKEKRSKSFIINKIIEEKMKGKKKK